jgi:transposase
MHISTLRAVPAGFYFRTKPASLDEGGRTWARIASLIETCKLNGVEPYAYLKATLEAIAAGHPSARIDELMPWNFDKQA